MHALKLSAPLCWFALAHLAAGCAEDTPPASGPPLTLESFLSEMAPSDRWVNTELPYRSLQSSSQEPGGSDPSSERWWTNVDRGYFHGFVERDGRREAVMLRANGPGVVQRIWSANPIGTIRIYLDGADEPLIEADMAALLGGDVAPFEDPFAYVSARGYNFYFPIPFAESVLITSDLGYQREPAVPPEELLYYHVGYRTYARQAVASLSAESLAAASSAIAEAGRAMLPEAPSTWTTSGSLREEVRIAEEGGGLITALQIDVPEGATATQLRHAVLTMAFDGTETVRAPLSDFFGSGAGLHDHRSSLTEVQGHTLTAWFPMGFRSEARIALEGADVLDADPQLRVAHEARAFGESGRYFHAGFAAFGPMEAARQDLPLLHLEGSGVYIGCSLVVANPVDIWWGEGDERIYVDDDRIDAPSFPGTGTEDYFGYAFIDPTTFSRPYHGQPVSGAPLSSGLIVNHRFHVLDDIPFRSRFVFDLELWHWTPAAEVVFEATLYWYAPDAGAGVPPLSPGAAGVPDWEALSPP
ncbi:MAG: glycoside hydrolase family 172 protein [Myxococcota bacterium]